jgi:hypothetical protein
MVSRTVETGGFQTMPGPDAAMLFVLMSSRSDDLGTGQYNHREICASGG